MVTSTHLFASYLITEVITVKLASLLSLLRMLSEAVHCIIISDQPCVSAAEIMRKCDMIPYSSGMENRGDNKLEPYF